MRFVSSLVLWCIVLVIGAVNASAEPPLRDVGPAARDANSGRSLLATDGRRVAYLPSADRVRVIDGQAREVADVPTPAGCAWSDFGGASLLWYCGSLTPGASSGVLYDVDTRAVAQLPELALPNDSATADPPTWWTVGRHWLGIYYIASGVRLAQYVNRTTGQAISASTIFTSVRSGVRRTPDLDRPDLMRPICKPLQPRFTTNDRNGRTPAPLAYQRPFGATLSSAAGGTRLLVGQCGARRVSVLSRCQQACGDPVVGDRAVAWLEGRSSSRETAARLRVRMLDRERTWNWSVSLPRRLEASTADPLVAMIGRRVFVLVQGKLQSVRLPAAKR